LALFGGVTDGTVAVAYDRFGYERVVVVDAGRLVRVAAARQPRVSVVLPGERPPAVVVGEQRLPAGRPRAATQDGQRDAARCAVVELEP
jgi:hypothetical protein